MSDRPAVLVIAGSDSSGGAGIIRDLQTLNDFAVDSLCVVTAVTAQSHSRTGVIHHVPPEVIREQMKAAFETRPISAIKIGMLGTQATVEVIASILSSIATPPPVVLDPVLVATSGGSLLDEPGREALRQQLFAHVTLLMPNIPEAATLLQEEPAQSKATRIDQAQRLLRQGPQAVFLKGGHSAGDDVMDVLVRSGAEPVRLHSSRVNVIRRGTGCTLASAAAAALACGASMEDACLQAKRHVFNWLSNEAG